MRSALLFVPAILFSILSTAQSTGRGKIKITITNEKAIAMENATVELIKAEDSSLVKVAITDKDGVAEFEKISFGSYLLKATMVNYGSQYSSLAELSESRADLILQPLTLEPQTTQLAAVTITGKKPFIQKLSDRLIVNVENSIVLTCPGCLEQKFLHLVFSELFNFFYTLTALTGKNASCKSGKN